MPAPRRRPDRRRSPPDRVSTARSAIDVALAEVECDLEDGARDDTSRDRRRRWRSREHPGDRMFDKFQRRVRRLRHLRPPRGGQPRLPRACTRCSTAARRARASPRADGERDPRPRAWATWPTSSPRRCSRGLPGRRAIGHMRYSTAGESRLLNAQPFLIDCAHGQIAVAHNGNLVNARELRDELVQRRLDLPDDQRHRGDPAPVRALARPPRSRRRWSSRSRRSRARIRWWCSTQDRLIAARDPHGFRPLALGQLGDACDRLLGDLRVRSHRRDLRARRRAGRGADRHRRQG